MSKDENLLDYIDCGLLSKQEVILAFINKWIPDIRMDLDTYLALNEYTRHDMENN